MSFKATHCSDSGPAEQVRSLRLREAKPVTVAPSQGHARQDADSITYQG